MRSGRGALLALFLAVVVVGGVVTWIVLAGRPAPRPGCTATAADGSSFDLTVEQAHNAATIAAVGKRLDMPEHAVTVALATAIQESRLRNLPGGDRDSAGLFQQRPSQGWGSYAEVTDPVYAATAFYERLREQPGWADLPLTRAAQLVQRSAFPEAYAQWETAAATTAAALTGARPAALTCANISPGAPEADIVPVARAELGTAVLSGPHPAAEGWAFASWLVANATRFGLDGVTFDGVTWTAESGAWTATGPRDGVLSLHRAR
ncbi:hypothetical protein GCM10017786_68260 [Amycolatopsis deserti]|uniref:Co/Zn/Cd efflux system component n=1 Tax=Amycolatopsis deserti TaxID=185696 RepID=A0ABQ3JGZ9_9PSEU|nr:hypothetical protein [Amycolatopsis deserti]GHF24583.1 hypothetical protein GCM10017786_68260 [Amycolatopsis deserti]